MIKLVYAKIKTVNLLIKLEITKEIVNTIQNGQNCYKGELYEKKTYIISVILLISLLFSACSSTSNDSNNNYNKENYNQSSESIELQSNKEAAMNAVYNYTYTFASKTHVSKVETVVISKCYLSSLDDKNY